MRSNRPSSAVPQRKSQDTSKLTEKLESINERMKTLSAAEENIDLSKKFAISEINDCFVKMIEEIEQRRAVLLSQVETKGDTARKSIARARESHKTLQQKLQKATTSQQSSASVDALLKESPDDVKYERFGVSFIPFNIQQLTDATKSAGQVRTIDFRPTDKPSHVPEKAVYNAIQIQPDDFPQVPDVAKITGVDVEIICPNLEWDRNTASSDITLSGTEVSNTEPVPPPPDTGCRLQAWRRVLASRSVVIRRGQRVMYHMRVRYSKKCVTPENTTIFELALTSYPVDANCNQLTGLSIVISSCPNHKQQLCLWVSYNNNWLADITLTRNQVGATHDLQLCVLLDSNTNKIHVVDAGEAKVIKSVTNVVFDKPLWVMMLVAGSDYADMRGELTSGNKVTVTQEIAQLLSSLTERDRNKE